MEGMPYYGGYGRKRYMEGLIPLIILVLIAIVLLGKTTNVFCGVPGLSAIFCGTQIVNIAVIGDFNGVEGDYQTNLVAPELKALLDGPLGKSYNMYYATYAPSTFVYAQEALLQNYDMVILVGDQAFTRPVKDAVGRYISGGGKLVVIGDAGVRDPDDPLYIGWGGGMFDNFPVRVSPNADIDSPIELSSPVIQIADIGHPIVRGYGVTLNLEEVVDKPNCSANLNLLDVTPTGGGIVAILSGDADGTRTDVPGIVESSAGFFGLGGGTVIYFAYDPGCTPNMWISAAGYITGRF
jgi:hypothetical protein